MRSRARVPILVGAIAGIWHGLAPPVAAQETQAVAPQSQSAPERLETAGAYIRVRDDQDGSVVMELASRVFVPRSGVGPRIHLVSAMHIADQAFYDAVQAALDKNDAVLFEGVKPPGTGATDAGASDEQKKKATGARLKFLMAIAERFRTDNQRYPASMDELVEGSGKRWKSLAKAMLRDVWGQPIHYELRQKVDGQGAAAETVTLTSDGPDGSPTRNGTGDDIRVEGESEAEPGAREGQKGGNLQAQMAKALQLTFQLDAIDSGKPNWRSSDISIDELQARMEAAGADATALLSMLDGSSFIGKLASVLLGFIGQSPQMSAMTKLMLVEMLGSALGKPGGAGGLELQMPAQLKPMMKVIVQERNAVVVNDLRGIIEREKSLKDVAVFYGAAHMADMQEQLTRDLNYEAGETNWMTAIRVNPKDTGYAPEQIRSMREMIKKMAAARMAK